MSEHTTAAVAAAAEPGGVKRRGRRWWLIALGLMSALAIGAGSFWDDWFATPLPPVDPGVGSVLDLDLRRPDALIESRSLSHLPRDLLRVPLLRDTLTEDFVFYYQVNGDRLGLAGSLRRIIYEHDLQLRDSILDELLDRPADVALWRGADGKLKHFLLVIQRGGLARLLEPLARVALDDSQLSRAGELQVDGAAVTLYRLRYNGERSLLFASFGEKLVVLSSPDLLFTAGGEGVPARAPAEAVQALLGGGRIFAGRFGLTSDTPTHRLTLGADFLALGYQRFIPAFAGLRFELDHAGWHAFLALNEVEDQPDLAFAPVWRAMPLGASACVALPVAPDMYQRLLERVGAEPGMAEQLAEGLSGAAGLCWYPDSRLHSPLLVATLNGPATAGMDAEFGRLFASVIGARESAAADGALPVHDQTEGELRQWQREVSSNFGQYPPAEAEAPDAIAARGFFRVSLARHGSTMLFSLDDRLVERGLSTLERHFPPLAEVLPKDALVPIYLAPQGLATLFEQETLDSLPADLEPVFRNAAETQLLPKLRALASHGKYALILPPGSEADAPWQWLALEWRAL